MALLRRLPPTGDVRERLPLMQTFLDIVAAWTALDIVLIATWHRAHVRLRQAGPILVPVGRG